MQFTALVRVSLILTYFTKCVSIVTNAYTNKELVYFLKFLVPSISALTRKVLKDFFFQIHPWAT